MRLDVVAFAQLKLAGSQGNMWVYVLVACLIQVCWVPKKIKEACGWDVDAFA